MAWLRETEVKGRVGLGMKGAIHDLKNMNIILQHSSFSPVISEKAVSSWVVGNEARAVHRASLMPDQ